MTRPRISVLTLALVLTLLLAACGGTQGVNSTVPVANTLPVANTPAMAAEPEDSSVSWHGLPTVQPVSTFNRLVKYHAWTGLGA